MLHSNKGQISNVLTPILTIISCNLLENTSGIVLRPLNNANSKTTNKDYRMNRFLSW